MTTKERVLEIFSGTREDQTAPYEEKDFLEFLIRPNGKQLDNSFKGKRYKMAFIKAVQMEFAICFTDDDYSQRWALDDFAARVEKRVAQRATSLTSAQKRLQRSKWADINLFLIVNAILLPPAFAIDPPIVWLYLLLPVWLNFLLLRFKLRDIIYHWRLVRRIQQSAP